jgi:hypothetical protein
VSANTRKIEVTPETREFIEERRSRDIDTYQMIQAIRNRATRDLANTTESFRRAIQAVQADANNAMEYLVGGLSPGHFGGRILHSSGVEVELLSGKWQQAVQNATYVLTQDEIQAAIKEGLDQR